MWKLIGKNLHEPTLLWWNFRSTEDGSTCKLYYGGASRVWYTTHLYGITVDPEVLMPMLSPEDLAAAAAAAIKCRKEQEE